MQLRKNCVFRKSILICLICAGTTLYSEGTPAAPNGDVACRPVIMPVYRSGGGDAPILRRILRVPDDFRTIATAVAEAKAGDWIIISPGKYMENNINIDKAVIVSSEWKLTGEVPVIDKTIIDSGDQTLFSITADSVEISGLHIVNGDHTLNILSWVTIRNNHFVNNLDAMSFESSSGGYVGYNTIENDRDDGLDIDIGSDKDKIGSNIVVEHNTIINSHDDGIEIRLFAEPDQNIHYDIRNNIIIGSKNAGIQLISYDKFTGKEFHIHHNILRECKTGLGCMEGSKTREDLSGASRMDELVLFYNNTLVENQMGATGGNNIIAVNNVLLRNTLGGFKRFGKKSAILNNLFYQNGGDDFSGPHDDIEKDQNVFLLDPLLAVDTFIPAANSPCIDAGRTQYTLNDKTIRFSDEAIAGSAPDIGAMEYGAANRSVSYERKVMVDAGEDVAVESPANELVLAGRVVSTAGKSHFAHWKLKTGPAKVNILNPEGSETKVVLHQEGIYEFSLIASSNDQSASDSKIVRYTRGGTGTAAFLDKAVNVIEAEDFAYVYGDVAVVRNGESVDNKYLKAESADAGKQTMVEYSIGTSENVEMVLWFLLRKADHRKSVIEVMFNNKQAQAWTVSNNKRWNWVRLAGKIKATAGQWPLLVRAKGGTINLDKIVIAFDESFIPGKMK